MSVTVSLSPLVLVAPTLLGSAVSADLDTFPLVVDADAKALAIEVALAETGQSFSLTNYTVSGTKRRFIGSFPLPPELGTYSVSLKAKDQPDASVTEISPNLTFQVIKASNVGVPQALPPSGIRIFRLANFVKVEWQKPLDDGFLGVRVVVSPDSSGVNTPFVQWGELVQGASRTTLDTLSSNITQLKNGQHLITTTDVEQVPVTYSSTVFPKAQVEADEFYVALTTVLQDPETHHVHESYAAGPFKCSFVDLRTVLPTDFPAAMTPEEIAVKLIQKITPDHPELDLSPRSELRDLMIDPVALELSNASTREWFTRVSMSVDALVGIDDADQDGASDDPATSDYKQALARAFRMSDSQVQAMIDSRFDVLGANHGLTRGGSEPAMVDVLFYILSKPTKRITISTGAILNTLPDADTPSVSFQALGSAVIDPVSADSFFLPDKGWWGVLVPCIATTPGTLGNVGAGTIRTVVSGVSQTMLCTNPNAASFGIDVENNHDFASRIKGRQVVGVDTGRRLGYEEEARKAYGVVDVRVVASGDLEMLRDWDPLRQKHSYGTVDVFARGRSFSQNAQTIPYVHATTGTQNAPSTWTKLRLQDAGSLRFALDGVILSEPMCALAELFVERQATDGNNSSLSFFLGVHKAKFDPVSQTFFLDPDELTYRVVNGTHTPGTRNASMVPAIQAGSTIWARVRTWSPLALTPDKQPVIQVYSVTGSDAQTGVIPTTQVRLLKTEDPLLEGGSSRSKDRVLVDNTTTVVTQTVTFEEDGPTVLDLGEGAYVPLDSIGNPQALSAVRSEDTTILYGLGRDYELVALGQYGRFGIKRSASSRIPLDTPILVSYPVYRFKEHLTLRTEVVTLSGSRFTALTHQGVVTNTWLPETHGLRELLDDTRMSALPKDTRYIRVLQADEHGVPQVKVEGRDFVLITDAKTGATQIARYVAGTTVVSTIAEDRPVEISYYTAELFTITTRYPQFVGQIAQRLEASRHAAADVLVKVMQENAVDLDFTVTLNSNASPEVLDRRIRTVIVAAFDTAKDVLSQAEIVRRIKALPGVKNVQVPFRRMAKSDGSYDIGLVIPTGTKWDPISTLAAADPTFANKNWPARTWVTQKSVLRYKTLPGGGKADAYVGLLYEGEAFKRVYSLNDFRLAQAGSFYVIGINDRFDQFTPVSSAHWGKVIMATPSPTQARPELPDPGQLPYRLTYQVFGEAGAQDIPLSPTEYLRPGRITIDYVLDGETR